MSAEERIDILWEELDNLGSILRPVGVITNPLVGIAVDQYNCHHG